MTTGPAAARRPPTETSLAIGGPGWQGVAGWDSEGLNVILRDIRSGGRRVAVGLAGWIAGQDRALTNARRASTEVSRRRVERDEVTIYVDALRDRKRADGESAEDGAEEWPRRSAQGAD